MTVVAGLVVQSEFQDMSSWKRTIVLAGHLLLWVQCGSEILAAFHGSWDTLPMATAEANVEEGSTPPMVENIITLSHAIPGTLLMMAWAILLHGLMMGSPATKRDE